MGVTYTEEQQQVIMARDCNLLVSAAAGSGKTAVLTQRIVDMVSDAENPVDIDRLLVVTFTNAAAAEMRERIRLALGNKLEQEPDNMHLQRQMTLLHNAQITTIDSFCLFLIRNHFQEIGLEPGFRVADEGELKLLRGEVMEELLEECFEAGEADFLHCVECLNQNGDEKTMVQYILQLYNFSESYPFPEEWLQKASAEYGVGCGEAETDSEPAWIGFAIEDMRKTVSGCLGQLKKAISICEEADGPYMYGELLEKECGMFSAFENCRRLSQWENAFAQLHFDRLPIKKDDTVSAEKREEVKAIRNGVKDVVEKMKKRYFFMPIEEAFADIQDSKVMVDTLISLTLRFRERLLEKKKKKNIIDFGDMEHYALQILLEKTSSGVYKPSAVAEEYQDYFYEIMIDEYQDSNLVQEYLLQSISGEEKGRYNRFMVGDVKQSIYKFRLARPEIFMEKYDRYGQYVEATVERRIDLCRNFRSRKEVTDCVNHVFSRIMKRELGGVDYDEKAALYPEAKYPESDSCKAELLILEEDKESELSKAEQEAYLVAEQIARQLRSGHVTDKETGKLRSVRYGDIAILLRSKSGRDEVFCRILKEKGIPAHVDSSTGYFASEEIRTMLHFLRILDNPLQDIPMFGVMVSPLWGFTEQEIAELRIGEPEGSLYEALQKCTTEKGKGFLAFLTEYRKKSMYEPVKQLLREAMAQTGYDRYMTAFPDGERRRANLEMLLLKAASYEQTGNHSLFSFIRYMEQLEQYEVDYGEAGVIDENADVVRIMSIHKSKGLEFPVCMVCGLGKRFNIQDLSKSFLTDMEMGVGCEYVNPVTRLRRTTLRRNVLARKQQLDNLGEELRILYVAMTRAREKLIMTACIPQPEKKLPKRSGSADEDYYLTLLQAGSLLDFLLPVWEGVRIVKWDELKGEEIAEHILEINRRQQLEEHRQEKLCPEWLDLFSDRFTFSYSWENLAQLYTKTTVSELKMKKMTDVSEDVKPMFDTQIKEAYIPKFRQEEKKSSGSMRGSAYHRVLELLDFKNRNIPAEADKSEVTKWIAGSMAGFVSNGRMKQEEADMVLPGDITGFLTSSAGKRLLTAADRHRLYREQPFMMGLAANRVNPDFPPEETILIQGIIDVYWEEEDALVLLDYKTDRVSSPEELISRYQLQLDYYAEALERLTGKKVKEKLIYSFCFDEVIYCKNE